jgi:ADP-ribosylglycohydrolase
MLGALAGDLIGSVHEFIGTKTKHFPLFDEKCFFTDDSILTIALANALLHKLDYAVTLKQYYRRYPHAGYGGAFHAWAASDSLLPYNSWGNGAAMRVSPVAYVAQSLDETLDLAELSAVVTHNHPEGIRGAQATAAAIFLARSGHDKGDIKQFIESTFTYDLQATLDEIRPTYVFDESCQGTVPQAITAFLEATDFVDAIRNAISLGGDADTLACIAGSIAEPYFGGLSEDLRESVLLRLDDELLAVTTEFERRFMQG